MTWRVEWAKEAVKDTGRLDRPTRKRIVRAVERLAEMGQGDLIRLRKPLAGHRLRVGDWRVFLQLDIASKRILVRQVRPRGSAYDRN